MNRIRNIFNIHYKKRYNNFYVSIHNHEALKIMTDGIEVKFKAILDCHYRKMRGQFHIIMLYKLSEKKERNLNAFEMH
jgi:hypothetical protein